MTGAGFDPAAPPPAVPDLLAAARRLHGRVRRTPLEPSPALGRAAGVPVWIKHEGMQRGGSFKLRGATSAVSALPAAARARGVVTASAGNHGVGVALAAAALGVAATVFLPADAPRVKRARIEARGAAVVPVAGGYDDAERAAAAFAAEAGRTFVHAFADPAVVAGQGTVGLEILADLPEVRTIVVPVGGGGLAGGVGIAARALGRGVRVLGVQTPETSAMHASLAAGELRSPPAGPTVCDGLAGDVNEWSLALARAVVDDVVLVDEAEVRAAMRRLYEEEGVVAEGSAAVAAAALWTGAAGALEGPVAVVLTGSNVDAPRLAAVLSA